MSEDQHDDEQRVIDLLAARRSALLVGPAGVGKTHRAHAVADHLAELDWAVERIVGSVSLRTVAFGALHHLVGDASAQQPDELFFAAMGQLQRKARTRPILVVVDDIDGLDDGSVALVHQLALSGVVVIATTRAEGAGEPHIVPLWKDGALERIDIVADDANTPHLAEALLGVPCQPDLTEALTALSGGNPLFIRELIADGRSSGAIEIADGTARLSSPLRVADRVSDLLGERFADLPDTTSAALETIAQVSPITTGALASHVASSDLEELEARNLVRIEVSSEHGDRVFVDHPLIGEVVRSRTSSLRARRIRAETGAAMLDAEPALPDLIRALQWLLDANEEPDGSALLRGARACLGRFDPTGALRFATAAPATFESWLVVGEAAARLGDLDLSDNAFSQADDGALDERQIAILARAQATARWWAHGDPQGARAMLDTALARVHEPRNRGPLVADVLLADALAGHLGSALTLGLPMLETAELDELTELSVLVCTTIAQALTGQVERLESHIERGMELAQRHAATHPAAPAQLTVTKACLEIGEGRFDRARATLDDQFSGPQPPILELFAAATRAQVDLLRGRGGDALVQMALIAEVEDDAFGMTVLRDAFASLVHAATGDVAESERLHNRATDNPLRSVRESAVLHRSAAHRLAFEGNVDAAIDLIVESEGETGDNWAWRFDLLHDAVRFGAADRVVDQLESQEFSRPLPYLDALVEHARALVERDVKRLAMVGEALAEMGSILQAAEAAAHASQCAVEEGETTTGARLATRAHALFDRSDSIWSLALQNCEPALSPRETEIAKLAATGLSTRVIGDQLFVSARTVDNHLRQVYRKLDLDGRQSLAPLFS